jgi:transposase
METRYEELSDLPLLGYLINQSPLEKCLDDNFPTHGNWRGPSVSKLMIGWLMYIISECDHRLYAVEDWASGHINTLRKVLGCANLDSSFFQDDRLGMVLEKLALDEPYYVFQSQYNSKLLQVYDLEKSTIRVDSFNAPSYREETPKGLFQFGYHKSHQADMPNLKTMMVTMDPLALPLATYVFSGNQPDDRNYQPAIKQARKSLQVDGLLYVGDTKIGSMANRSYLARTGNYYICPLSHSFYPREMLRQGIEQALADKDHLQSVCLPDPKTGKDELIAQLYELPSRQCSDSKKGGQWTERLVLALSIPFAQAQETIIRDRIQKVSKILFERFLPRKYRQTWTLAQQEKAAAFVERTLKQHRVDGLLDAQLTPPAQDSPSAALGIRLTSREEVIKQGIQLAAWRIYVTNASTEKLSPEKMLRCYRNEYRIEHQFHRMLTKTTKLLPIYLKDESRIKALIRLLTLALQFVTIIQHTVRQNLKEEQQPYLTDLVPGNKNRKVPFPTTELLLKRFKGIVAIWMQPPDQPMHAIVRNLEPIHCQILRLLKCPEDLYIQHICAYLNIDELV